MLRLLVLTTDTVEESALRTERGLAVTLVRAVVKSDKGVVCVHIAFDAGVSSDCSFALSVLSCTATKMPCFSGGPQYTLDALRDRFMIGLPEDTVSISER